MSFKISVEEEEGAWSSKQGLKKRLWSIQHRPSNLCVILFRCLLIKTVFWLLYMYERTPERCEKSAGNTDDFPTCNWNWNVSEKFRVCTVVGVDLIEMELGKKSVVI